MTLAKKFIISLILSILFIAVVNILAFYVFYSSYLETYFTEKINSREKITLSYINKIIEQQTIDEIGSIFSDTEIEIYELFEKNNWEILLSNENSIDLIVNYLVKNKVTPEYIEEIIPVNNVWKVLEALQDKNSPEYNFLNKLTFSILLTNIAAILVIIICMLLFTRKIISPIRRATENIKNSEHGKEYKEIQYYNKHDEIWLLIDSINVLNKKLNLQEEIRSRLLADISHPAGLIAKGILSDPLPYCHIVTTTTHKTLRGPRGGMIMMGKDFENPFGLTLKSGKLKKMSTLLNASVFPGNQGGPLEHVIAAKAVAFGEALTDEFLEYQIQVRENARAMAAAFITKGYHIISGGTDNHMMLIDLRNKGVTGKDAELALGKAEITVNKNMVPFDTQSPFVTSGIRIGTSAITTRGLIEEDMTKIVDLIDEVIMNIENDEVLETIADKVYDLMHHKRLFVM